MSKYVIDSATLVSIGDAVREKDGTTGAILVSDIPARIKAIPQEGGGGGAELPEEAFNFTGDCSYKFAYLSWNWYLDAFGNKIKTKDITNAEYMFYNNNQLETIPIEINMVTENAEQPMIRHMFSGCDYLKEVPKITGIVRDSNGIFKDCTRLLEVSEESVAGIDWSLVDNLTASGSVGSRADTFNGCYCLRKFPMDFLAHGNPKTNYSNCVYRNLFNYCAVLDEVVDLPVIHADAGWTSNGFNSTVNYCARLKRFTFATKEDGTPYEVNWKKQTINFDVGYNIYPSIYILPYGDIHGITSDKRVKDDATYQALKDDKDWYTEDINYSRYNHDSAVETINSLPITPSGGGNTIKFKGAAGALTDGGAINTLTEEEIAVATAKGWTVTLT